MNAALTVIAVGISCLVLSSASYAQEDVLRPSSTKRPKPHADPPATTAPADSTHPQTQWFVGVNGGVSNWWLSQSIAGAQPESPVHVYEDASGLSPLISAQMHVALRPWLRIGVVGGFSPLKAAGALQESIAEGAITDPLSGYLIAYKDVRVDMNTTYDMSTAFVGADVQWLPFDGLVINAGPVIQFATSPLTITTTQSIAPGETFRFWDGNAWSTSVTTTEVISDAKSPSFGVAFGVAYEVPITEMLYVVPRCSYVLLTALTDEQSRKDGSRLYSSGLVTYTAGPINQTVLRASVGIICKFGH